ncbi:hypothetical protein [Azorhizobium doebereinerae]|nr:hypothetical protein [Azorhizobium doebereinerae]
MALDVDLGIFGLSDTKLGGTMTQPGHSAYLPQGQVSACAQTEKW